MLRFPVLFVVPLLCSLWLITPGVGAANSVDLTYLTWMPAGRMELVERSIENFRMQHPNVNVEIIFVESSNVAGEALLTMMAGGVVPDIAHVWHTDAPAFFRQGMAMDLTPFIERDNFDTSILPPNFESMTYEGRWYGLPRDGGAFSDRAIYYNRDHFSEGGIAFPNSDWTWESFREIAQRLTRDRDGDGTPEQWGFRGNSVFGQDWPIYLWSGGGEIFDETRENFVMNSPEAADALQWWADLKLVHGIDGWNQANFNRGNVAIESGAYMRANNLNNVVQPEFDWSIVGFPHGRAGSVNLRSTHPLIIPAGAKHPEEAWEFIKFTLSDENQYNQVIAWRGFPPQTIDVARHPELLNLSRPPYSYAPFAATVGRTFPVSVPKWPQIQQIIVQGLRYVWDGNTSARLAMDAIEPQIEALLQ